MSSNFVKLGFDLLIIALLIGVLNSNFGFLSMIDCCLFITNLMFPLLFYHLFFLIRRKNAFFRFDTYFILLEYLFFFGRIVLRAFSLDKHIFWDLFRWFDEATIFQAGLLALIYTHVCFFVLTTNWKTQTNPTPYFEIPDKYIKPTSIFFTLITFPLKLYCDYLQILAQQIAQGYVSLIKVNGVLYCIGSLFPVAIMFLLYALEKSQKYSRIILFSFYLYTIFVMVLSGDRRYAAISLLIITLYFVKLHKITIPRKNILLVILSGFVGLTALAAIRNIRNTGGSLTTFVGEFFRQIVESNIIYETCAEFGISFFTLVVAIVYYGKTLPFFYGSTFFASILTVIPGIGVFFKNYIFAQSTIQVAGKLHEMPLGGSIYMDVYGNFGIAGSIIFLAVFFVSIKHFLNWNKTKTKFGLLQYYSLCLILLNLIRASILEITRMAVYSILIPFALYFILKHLSYKKR